MDYNFYANTNINLHLYFIVDILHIIVYINFAYFFINNINEYVTYFSHQFYLYDNKIL